MHSDKVSCSRACADKFIGKKLSKLVGSKSSSWKGGVSADHNHGFRGNNWPKVSEKIRKRDKYKCQHCGMTNEAHIEKHGKQLEVHHIVPFHNFTDFYKANKPSNLITLCMLCHRKEDATVEAVQLSLPMSKYKRGQRVGLPYGEKHHNRKLNNETVMKMRRLYYEGASAYRIAKDLEISHSAASFAIHGKTWKHLPILGRPEKRGEA